MGRTSGALAITLGSVMVATLFLYWVHTERKKRTDSQEKRSNFSQLRSSENGDAESQADEILNGLFQEAAAKAAKGLPSATTGDKLVLYGLYKQATMGNIPEDKPEPSKIFLQEYTKHASWKNFKGMTRQKAMIHYMQAVQHFSNDEGYSIPSEYSQGNDDFEPGDLSSTGLGVRVSTLVMDDDENESNNDNSSLEAGLRKAAAMCDSTNAKNAIEDVKSFLKRGVNVNDADESGQTALHFAADRGSVECLRLLIDHGANVDKADLEGISVLQAAVIAGNVAAVNFLLDAGANPDQEDMDGDTPRSCAQDDGSEQMKVLFVQEVQPQ